MAIFRNILSFHHPSLHLRTLVFSSRSHLRIRYGPLLGTHILIRRLRILNLPRFHRRVVISKFSFYHFLILALSMRNGLVFSLVYELLSIIERKNKALRHIVIWILLICYKYSVEITVLLDKAIIINQRRWVLILWKNMLGHVLDRWHLSFQEGLAVQQHFWFQFHFAIRSLILIFFQVKMLKVSISLELIRRSIESEWLFGWSILLLFIHIIRLIADRRPLLVLRHQVSCH